MTFWDRLVLEYPEMRKKSPMDKAVKCPCSWGYERKPRGLCVSMKSCDTCWMREMKEEK